MSLAGEGEVLVGVQRALMRVGLLFGLIFSGGWWFGWLSGFCWGSLDELFRALAVDLDLLFSQFIDFLLLVCQ